MCYIKGRGQSQEIQKPTGSYKCVLRGERDSENTETENYQPIPYVLYHTT